MILVSACLAGFPCRWDGKSLPDLHVIQLVRDGKAIPICPEQLGGQPTPRPPAERQSDRVITREGDDVTARFRRGAEIALATARTFGCRTAILKSFSPSCGKDLIYDGSFTGKLVRGSGITAELFMRHGIKVFSEHELPPDEDSSDIPS